MCEFCKNIAMNDDEYMRKRYDGVDFTKEHMNYALSARKILRGL